MAIIKSSVTTITEVEREINIPSYFQTGKLFYKVLSEKEVMIVETYDWSPVVQCNTISSLMNQSGNKDFKEITEDEFLSALENSLKFISEKSGLQFKVTVTLNS